MKHTLKIRKLRTVGLRSRITSSANDHFPKCTIIGCGRPTQRAERSGLAIALCRKHLDHRQRHGSPFCPSPSAVLLKPYLKAALRIIDQRREEMFVKSALAGLEGLMRSGGNATIAPRLKGLPPGERARVALARLREAGTKPERLLAIVLAVHALIEDAPEHVHRIKDWRIVAIAKVAHRLASGHHVHYEATDEETGIIYRSEYHAYPRSSGRVLRHLGELLEREAEHVIDRRLSDVVGLKRQLFGSS